MKIIQKFLAVAGAVVLTLGSLTSLAVPVEAAAPVFEQQDYDVLTNIIGAIESGGQVYGKRDYSCYAAAYENSEKEYTCTLGWAQFYGAEAKTLIQRIYQADPNTFKAIDSKGQIQNKLSVDWVAARWNPSPEEKQVLVSLITTKTGKAIQDSYFMELTKPFVRDCAAQYTNDIRATMMYVEIRHLGGPNPVKRIFNRLGGNYSVDNILASLKKDQDDKSSSNQVGDARYWTRHQKCVQWIKQYARSSGSASSAATNSASIPSNSTGNGKTNIYRLYNRNTGEHFYTRNYTEAVNVRNAGWDYEGVGWIAPEKSSKPIYRMYNPNVGDHHYTASDAERNMLVNAGWRNEGIAFYSDSSQTRSIYREYNPNASVGSHNYTLSAAEHNKLISAGWRNEGTAFHAAA